MSRYAKLHWRVLYLFNQRNLKDICLKENDDFLRVTLEIVSHLVSLDSIEAMKSQLFTPSAISVENLD